MNENNENVPSVAQEPASALETRSEATIPATALNPAVPEPEQTPVPLPEKRAEVAKAVEGTSDSATNVATAASAKPDSDPASEPESQKQTREVPKRNFEAEWKELAEAHPEVVGTTLPQDIFQACITSDKPPLQVYESMMLQHLQSEISQLKQENDRLRQNADNAQRAPVTGTSNGGSAHTEEEDPFVAAFRRYR